MFGRISMITCWALGLVLGLGLIAGPASAGESVQPAPAVNDEFIQIGTWAPTTGPSTPWGATVRGTATYFAMINAAGGVGGRQLRLITFNDRENPALIRRGIKKLVNEKGVLAFIGWSGTALGQYYLPDLVERGLPWIGLVVTPKPWTKAFQKSVFALCPPLEDEAAALAKYGVEVLGRKRVALVYQEDDLGRRGLEGVARQIKNYNLTLAAKVAIPLNGGDYTKLIDDLAAAQPEIVILWTSPTPAVAFRTSEVLADSSLVWMTGSFLSDAGVMNQMTDGRWAGTIFSSIMELPGSDSELLSRYYQSFRELAPRGEVWGPFFYSGFALAEPVVEALRRCGADPTREKLVAALEGLQNFQGIGGRISFSPTSHQGQREMFLAEALVEGRSRQLTGWFAMDR